MTHVLEKLQVELKPPQRGGMSVLLHFDLREEAQRSWAECKYDVKAGNYTADIQGTYQTKHCTALASANDRMWNSLRWIEIIKAFMFFSFFS